MVLREFFFYCESSYSVVRIVFIVRKFGLVETKLDDSFPTAQFSLSGLSKPLSLSGLSKDVIAAQMGEESYYI